MGFLKVTRAPRFDVGFIPIGRLPPKTILEVTKGIKKQTIMEIAMKGF